jgi:hypothetical protein
LVWLRQRRQEPEHTQVVSLPQPLQLQLRGQKLRIGTLHGEVKRLKPVNAEHVSRPAPNRVQAGNLQRAAPVRTGNGLGHAKRNDDRLATGRLEHPACGNATDSGGAAKDLLIGLSTIVSGRTAQDLYAAQPIGNAVPTGAVLVHQPFLSIIDRPQAAEGRSGTAVRTKLFPPNAIPSSRHDLLRAQSPYAPFRSAVLSPRAGAPSRA